MRAGAWARAASAVLVVAMAVVLLAARFDGTATQLPAGHGGHAHAGETTTLPPDVDAAMRAGGAVAALDRLDELIAGQALPRTVLHQVTHEVGRRGYTQAGGDVARAFAGCDARRGGGCYHGVFQAFLTTTSVPPDLAALCDGVVIPRDAPRAQRFHCMHGLGHGLARAHPSDPLVPLARCDATGAPDVADCRVGVLMEHAVAAAGQPAYTCASLPERYHEPCFTFIPPAAALLRDPGDVPAAFAACDAVPQRFVPACYASTGREIVDTAGAPPAQVPALCALGASIHQGQCLRGAAAILISVGRTAEPGLAVCRAAPASRQPVCFEHVGRLLYALHPQDPGRRAGVRISGCGRAGAVPPGCRRAVSRPASTPAAASSPSSVHLLRPRDRRAGASARLRTETERGDCRVASRLETAGIRH